MQESIKQEKKEHRNLNKVQHSFSGVVIPLVFFVIPPGGLVIRMGRVSGSITSSFRVTKC